MGKLNSDALPNPPLPRWESAFYILTWITIALLMIKSVFETSRDYSEHRDVSYGLDDGWSFLGRQKDITDSEWEFWRDSMFGVLGKWMVGHVILGQFLRIPFLFPKRKYIFLVYSLLFYVNVVGFGQLLLIVLEIFIIFSIIWFTASSAIVWAFSLTFLMILNIDFLRLPLVTVGLLRRGHYYEFLFQEFTLAMTVQRLVSFGLFNCDYRKKILKIQSESVKIESPQTNNQTTSRSRTAASLDSDNWHKATDDLHADVVNCPRSAVKDQCAEFNWEMSAFSCSAMVQLFDLFFYVFYVPLIIAGPMMNYDVFYKQFHKGLERWSITRLKPVIFGLFRCFFWGFFYDFMLHYLYSGPIINRPNLLSMLPLWTIAGIGYMHGMFFVMKYVIVWGFCTSVAKLDQLQPPDGPTCGSHIYLYSEMWKTFDRGLYAFLKQHVYIILGGSRHGLFRRVIAVLMCFGFVLVWHGLHNYILLWCLLNFLSIMLETAATSLVSSPPVKEFEAKYFSPAMIRRLHSLAIIPVLGISTFSLVTFFAGLKSGRVLFSRLVFEGFPVSTILVIISLYCVIQTGKEVENYQAQRQHSKED